MRLWPLVLLLAFATRLPAFEDRFYSNDEATYSALAGRVAHGGSMYADAVDHKPPGIVSVYAAVFQVAGVYRIRPVRLVLVAAVALTAILVGELAAIVAGDPRARVAALLYVLASATGFPDNVQPANTELFLNVPLAAAAVAIALAGSPSRFRRTLLLSVAAGALTGVAALFKYQAALAGIAWLGAGLLERSRPRVLTIAAGLALGFAAVAAALVGHYAQAGHLDAFLFWGWRYNFSYIASMPLGRQAARALARSAVMALFWAPLVVSALRSWHTPSARARAVPLLWLACMAGAVATGGRYFGNYYLMLLPPLAVLAGAAVPRRRVAAAAGALAAASVVAALSWTALRPAGAREDDRYREAAAWVRAHSSPADRLFVWGDSAQLYPYSGRLMATRFAFTNYHTGKIWGTGADEENAPARPDLIVPRAWVELLDDFRRTPPGILVDAAAGGLHGFGGQGMDHYPALWTIVRSNYYRATTVAGMPVYRLRRPANP